MDDLLAALVKALERHRLGLGWTHGRFAEELGVAQSTWSRALTGDSAASPRVLLGACKAFPREVALFLRAYLRESNPSSGREEVRANGKRA